MEHSQIYQRFLNLCSAIDKIGTFPALEPYERCLLNKINEYWVKKEPLTVLQALDINQNLSRATTHKYLKSLHAKGYIDLKVDHQDNRFKFIKPSAMTYKYFDALGKSLIESTASI